MTKTNLKKMLNEAGLESVRPSSIALDSMKISRRRFTNLFENTHKSPISVQELQSIKKWIIGIKEIKPDELIRSDN
jgi:hypothetical protein